MLEVKNLSVTYLGNAQAVFTGLSFTLNSGQLLHVSGANGSGKTTLLYALCNVIPREIMAERTGEIRLDGENLTEKPLNTMIPDVMIAMHHPGWQLFFPSVQAEIVFALENMGLETPDIKARLSRALQTFQLQKLAHANPAELSQGMQKMVLMAVMDAIQARIMLLDEPLNSLSMPNKSLVLHWMQDYLENGKSIIIAEHDKLVSPLKPILLHMPLGLLQHEGV